MSRAPRVPVVGDHVRVAQPFGTPYYGTIVDRLPQKFTDDMYAIAFEHEPGSAEWFPPDAFTVMTRRAAA